MFTRMKIPVTEGNLQASSSSASPGTSSQGSGSSQPAQSAQTAQQQYWQLYYEQQQRYAQQYAQYMATYQQMCQQASNGVQTQTGQPAAQNLQRMGSYPYYGAWTPTQQTQQPTVPLQRAQSAPTPQMPSAAQPTQLQVPETVPEAQPVEETQQVPAVHAPVEAEIPPPVLENAVPAQPARVEPPAPQPAQRNMRGLLQPAVAFRLFMFYYLFCSPSLPDWQRTLFIGALVVFYLYTVDLLGYLFPDWRRRRNEARANADLDVIPQGPNDADGENDQRAQPHALSRQNLLIRFVVGLFASLLPSWTPARFLN